MDATICYWPIETPSIKTEECIFCPTRNQILPKKIKRVFPNTPPICHFSSNLHQTHTISLAIVAMLGLVGMFKQRNALISTYECLSSSRYVHIKLPAYIGGSILISQKKSAQNQAFVLWYSRNVKPLDKYVLGFVLHCKGILCSLWSAWCSIPWSLIIHSFSCYWYNTWKYLLIRVCLCMFFVCGFIELVCVCECTRAPLPESVPLIFPVRSLTFNIFPFLWKRAN